MIISSTYSRSITDYTVLVRILSVLFTYSHKQVYTETYDIYSIRSELTKPIERNAIR